MSITNELLRAYRPMDKAAQAEALAILAAHPVLEARAENLNGALGVRVRLASGHRYLWNLDTVRMLVTPIQFDADGEVAR